MIRFTLQRYNKLYTYTTQDAKSEEKRRDSSLCWLGELPECKYCYHSPFLFWSAANLNRKSAPGKSQMQILLILIEIADSFGYCKINYSFLIRG